MQLSVRGLGPILLGLAACAAPVPPPAPLPVVPVAPADPTPGFLDREPDTCKSADLRGLVGQPSGMVRTVRTAGPVRIIAPGTVYDQEEYRSNRINVFVDGEGTILQLSCG